MAKFCMPSMLLINSLAYTLQAIMVDGRIVYKYLEAAVADMFENKRKEINCPCRKCKQECLIDPFVDGHLKAHLLMYGFMDGYTWWISEDDEDVDGAENNEGEDNNDQGPEQVWNEEAPGHEEESKHGEEAGMPQAPSLTSV